MPSLSALPTHTVDNDFPHRKLCLFTAKLASVTEKVFYQYWVVCCETFYVVKAVCFSYPKLVLPFDWAAKSSCRTLVFVLYCKLIIMLKLQFMLLPPGPAEGDLHGQQHVCAGGPWLYGQQRQHGKGRLADVREPHGHQDHVREPRRTAPGLGGPQRHLEVRWP